MVLLILLPLEFFGVFGNLEMNFVSRKLAGKPWGWQCSG